MDYRTGVARHRLWACALVVRGSRGRTGRQVPDVGRVVGVMWRIRDKGRRGLWKGMIGTGLCKGRRPGEMHWLGDGGSGEKEGCDEDVGFFDGGAGGGGDAGG